MQGAGTATTGMKQSPDAAKHKDTPSSTYFTKFGANGFIPERDAQFADEFDRLADHMGWLNVGKAYRKQRSEAIKQQPRRPQGEQSATSRAYSHMISCSDWAVDTGLEPKTGYSFDEEFSQLAQLQGWSKNSKQFRQQKILAAESQIRQMYGEGSKLQGWQQLCFDVGINPTPLSITKCKAELAKVQVNLYDLIDWRRLPPPRRPFDKHKSSLKALQAYSIKSNKIFPKEAAKEEGFIRALLRHIQH